MDNAERKNAKLELLRKIISSMTDEDYTVSELLLIRGLYFEYRNA